MGRCSRGVSVALHQVGRRKLAYVPPHPPTVLKGWSAEGVTPSMLKRPHILAALVLASVSLGCGNDPSALDYGGGTFDQHLELGGTTRDYIVYVPPDLDPGTPAPVLFAFHGAEGSADGMMLLTWFNAEARDGGFVAVYPDSDGGRWDFTGSRDLAFVDAIVERIAADILIDDQRIFASGFSNGALMAIWMACNRSDQVAGAGIVGGTVPAGLRCTFRRSIPAVFILGDEDRQFPFHEGSAVFAGQLSASASVGWWMERNGCASAVEIIDLPDEFDDGTSAHRWDHPACTGSQAVSLYEIRGGGHTWPGSPLKLPPSLGAKSKDIRASGVIADFLLEQSGGP